MEKVTTVAEKFCEMMKKKRLFGAGETVLLAVSGGLDSVSLLHLVKNLPPKLRPGIAVAHFNHRLRGRESEDEARFVEGLCRKWNLPFSLGRAPAWKTRSNLEERARELRYRYLKQAAQRQGICKILTAHQADDQAETFLIRWLRGAGLRGLSGIRPVREEGDFLLIRPLLEVSRLELSQYARFFRIPFRKDSSNESQDYLRNRVRKLLKGLRKENPRLAITVSRNASFLQADQDLLESLTDDFFGREVESRRSARRCALSPYRGLPKALRHRVLQKMVRDLTSLREAFPSELILKLDSLLENPAPRQHYDLPKGLGFTKEYVWWELYTKPKSG